MQALWRDASLKTKQVSVNMLFLAYAIVCVFVRLFLLYNGNKRMTSIALILSKSASIQSFICSLCSSLSPSLPCLALHYHSKFVVCFVFLFLLFRANCAHYTSRYLVFVHCAFVGWLLFYLFTDKCADRYFKYITLNYIRNYAKRKLVC